MDLTRRPEETNLDHHKRIVYGKLVDKTLADIDYAELSNVLYGQEYSSDVARRMMYGSKRTLDIMSAEDERSVTGESMLSELERKKAEIQMERIRFFDQRREYSKLISADGRQENLFERLGVAAEHLNDTIGKLYQDTAAFAMMLDDKSPEAVLVLNDWHYGMTTENVFNKFDTEVCKARVIEIAEQAASRICAHSCQKLHIVLLGDFVHGAIHTTARVASEELVCDQIMQVAEILAQTIEYLSQNVVETVVYFTYGNHARTVQSKKDSIHRDNMERLIPWWLEQRLRDYDSISICEDTGNEFLFINACGHEICASHGDLDDVKSSTRLLPTLLHRRLGKDVEYILLGDKHHRESFEELGVSATICGSLCGTDDYANGKRLYSTPSQLLVIVTREDGVDAEYRLKPKTR